MRIFFCFNTSWQWHDETPQIFPHGSPFRYIKIIKCVTRVPRPVKSARRHVTESVSLPHRRLPNHVANSGPLGGGSRKSKGRGGVENRFWCF